MLCEIAELITEIPNVGDMLERCRAYLCEDEIQPHVVIEPKEFRTFSMSKLSYEDHCYLESGLQYFGQLIKYDGLVLHASAVELNGKAYLFSGPSGMGKSTHTKLWQQVFGPAAQVFNDDKPALRYIDGKWYAYGTPWCGKDGINQNKKVSLAGICFLKRGDSNNIRMLNSLESVRSILGQTRKRKLDEETIEQLLKNIDKLVENVPIFELKNRPEPEAAILSYETMCQKAEEIGL